MKKKILILGLLILAGTCNVTLAQDKKEWKKKLKALTPDQYKKLVEDNQSLQTQLADSKKQTEHYKSEVAAKDAEVNKLKKQLDDQKQTSVMQASASPAKTETPSRSSANNQGLIYKVQIGAFKNKDLKKYLENHQNFSGEIDTDGTKKYTLGEFNDYWEADKFKKYLREMGVKDAWIVSYKDGKRVPIKDALEGVL